MHVVALVELLYSFCHSCLLCLSHYYIIVMLFLSYRFFIIFIINSYAFFFLLLLLEFDAFELRGLLETVYLPPWDSDKVYVHSTTPKPPMVGFHGYIIIVNIVQ